MGHLLMENRSGLIVDPASWCDRGEIIPVACQSVASVATCVAATASSARLSRSADLTS
jgi:hypothetical protein